MAVCSASTSGTRDGGGLSGGRFVVRPGVVLQAEHAKTAEYGASDQKEVADEVKWQRAIYQVQVLFEHQQPQKTEDAEEGNVGERRGDLSAAGTAR